MGRRQYRQSSTNQGLQPVSETEMMQKTNFFSRRELAELPRVLVEGEQALAVLSGFYAAGTAILCVTSHRLLLVDKKMIRLSLEDVRFEAIREVHYSHQPLIASMQLYYAGREMQFRTWYKNELRMCSQLVQQKMFEVRESLSEPPPSADTSVSVRQVSRFDPLRQANQLRKRLQPLEHEYTKEQEAGTLKPAINSSIALQLQRIKKASSFVDRLRISTKAGRQVVELEIASALGPARTDTSRR